MIDIHSARQTVFLPFIKDLLRRGDSASLQGLQTLDSSIAWTGTMGTESVIAMLFTETLKLPSEIEKYQQIFDDEAKKGIVVQSIKTHIDILKDGYIPLKNIQDGCKGIRHFIEDINILYMNDFVELYPEETDAMYVRLSSLWRKTIDNIKILGEETEVFGSAIGTLISIAIHGKGIGSLRPLIHAYEIANEKGEISTDDWDMCCGTIPKPKRFVANLIERDRKKHESIRAFERYDDIIILNRNGIRAIRQWNKLANEHLLSITKSRT